MSNSATVVSVTDAQLGGTYTLVRAMANGTIDTEIWQRDTPVTTAASLQLTITVSAPASIVAEVVAVQTSLGSGVVMVDSTGVNSGGGPIQTVPVASTQDPRELILAAFVQTSPAAGGNSFGLSGPSGAVFLPPPAPAPAGQAIAGALVGYFTATTGTTNITTTTSPPAARPWAGVGVSLYCLQRNNSSHITADQR